MRFDSRISPAVPLRRHPGFRTQDPDAARDLVAQRFCDHVLDPVADFDRFDAVQNSVGGRAVSLHYLRYGATVDIDPGELGGFFLVQMPLAGRARVRHGPHRVDSDPATGTILNPDRATRMRWNADCAQIMVQIDRDALARFAQGYLGRELSGPIRFAPALRFADADLRRWRQAVLDIARGCDAGGLSALPRAIEEQLLAGLVERQFSTLSPFLDCRTAPILPRHVKRAMDYIRAHALEDVTLTAIASASGVGARALQIGFRDHVGITPMQAVTQERLRRARADLLSDAKPRIGTVAARHRFANASRFSRAYEGFFGTRPKADIGRI